VAKQALDHGQIVILRSQQQCRTTKFIANVDIRTVGYQSFRNVGGSIIRVEAII
jgi:hypothetical protein